MPSSPNRPAVAGPITSARAFAFAVAVLACSPGAWLLFDQNLRLFGRWLLLPAVAPEVTEEGHWKGYGNIVGWAKHAGLQRLYALPYESNPYVYQRFIEMLYPIELVNVAESELKAGALVLVTKDKGLQVPHAQLFSSGDFALVMVHR